MVQQDHSLTVTLHPLRCVLVARLWKLITKGSNETYAINMQFIDCKGNENIATIRKHNLQHFEGVFQESSVYDITRFNVQDAEKTYRTIDDETVIVIRSDSESTKWPNQRTKYQDTNIPLLMMHFS